MKYGHLEYENTVEVERRGPGRPFSTSKGDGAGDGAIRLPPARSSRGEVLAFTVGLVGTDRDLQRVQALRAQAYGHHLPGLAAHFGRPDPVDHWPDVVVFFAQDKESGRVVGSARLQCNRTAALQVERNLELPEHLQGRHLGEVTRLAVLAGYPHPVRLALVKALHLYCVAAQIEGVLAASRPSLIRQYLNLGFADLFGDERLAPIDYGGGLPHRILYRDVVTSEAHHRERQHPDYGFVFRTYHPDIAVGGTRHDPSDRAPLLSGPVRRYVRAA